MAYTYEQLLQMGAQPVGETAGYSYEDLVKMGAQPVTQTTPAPQEVISEDNNNMLQDFAQNTLVRPAIRVGQLAGEGLLRGVDKLTGGAVNRFAQRNTGQDLSQRLDVARSTPIKTGAFGVTAPQKGFDNGGVKQLAIDTGKSALDIATLGAGSAVNTGIKTGIQKATLPLATKLASVETTNLATRGLQKAGQYALKKAPGILANATEGVAYNTAYNALNEKPLMENAGISTAGAVVIPGVIGGIAKGYQRFTPKGIQDSINKELDNLFTATRSIGNKVKLAEQRGVNLRQELSDPQLFKELKVIKGKIDTTTAVEKLDNDIEIALSSKRSLIPELDRITPEVPREVVRQKAIEDVTGRYSPADEQDIIEAINRQVDALPEIMKPSQIDDLRAKFRTSARDARGIQKRSSEYSALENATRNTMFELTDNLPFDTNKEYQSLNNYIKNKIATKEFVEKTLNNQVVKGGKLNRYAMRTIGAIGGLKGGFLGSLAGAEAGGIISDIIVNNQLGSSLKMQLIKNITDDPAVIKKAEAMLSKAQRYTPEIPLQLEAGALRMGGKNPSGGVVDATGKVIDTGSTIEMLPAQKNPISVNPKTGKFQKTYSSYTPNMSLQNTANSTIQTAPNIVIPDTISNNTQSVKSSAVDKLASKKKKK
jgi:hypothetical protein